MNLRIFFLYLLLFAAIQPNLFSQDVIVKKMTLTSAIVEREAVDSLSTPIKKMDKIWAYAVLNAAIDSTERLSFVWERNNDVYLEFPVTVRPSKRWRTYSYVTARTGKWKLRLIDSKGIILKELNFEVED